MLHSLPSCYLPISQLKNTCIPPTLIKEAEIKEAEIKEAQPPSKKLYEVQKLSEQWDSLVEKYADKAHQKQLDQLLAHPDSNKKAQLYMRSLDKMEILIYRVKQYLKNAKSPVQKGTAFSPSVKESALLSSTKAETPSSNEPMQVQKPLEDIGWLIIESAKMLHALRSISEDAAPPFWVIATGFAVRVLAIIVGVSAFLSAGLLGPASICVLVSACSMLFVYLNVLRIPEEVKGLWLRHESERWAFLDETVYEMQTLLFAVEEWALYAKSQQRKSEQVLHAQVAKTPATHEVVQRPPLSTALEVVTNKFSKYIQGIYRGSVPKRPRVIVIVRAASKDRFEMV